MPRNEERVKQIAKDYFHLDIKLTERTKWTLIKTMKAVSAKLEHAAIRIRTCHDEGCNRGLIAFVESRTVFYPQIVKDLSPTASGTFSISCGGNKFEDKVTTYSRRKTYWNYQIVVDHEAFHRKDSMDTYRKELVNAESNIWAHSLPESEASDKTGAIHKANAALTKYMTDAYQNTCKVYGHKQESNAYDDGAPQYQTLVDEIRARGKGEWK